MPFFYILYSHKKSRYYIGSTRNTVESRLKRHICSHKGFTSQTNDWIIAHCEYFDDFYLALAREREVKSWKSRKLIENLIYSGG